MNPNPENPFEGYFEKYANNTKLWVRDSFFPDWQTRRPFIGSDAQRDAEYPGWRSSPDLLYGPDGWQDEVMDEYDAGTRLISIRSGHRVGKTTVLSWIIAHQLIFKFPQKTVATAATQDQLFDALAAETKSWIGKLPAHVQALLEVKSEEITLRAKPTESFARFRVSRADKPEALAGVHSKYTLLIGDEASGIPDPIFEAGWGSLADDFPIFILAGNPVRSSGLFYETHRKPEVMVRWKQFHVNAETSPRVNREFIEDIRTRFGEQSNSYRIRVLGEFPLADDDAIIPTELAEAALKRDVTPHKSRQIWGLDVARYGRDKSALARRRGNVLIRPIESRGGYDLMQTVGWLKQEYDDADKFDKPEVILIDSNGLGAGVYDRARELGLPVRGINVSEAPAMRERYKNMTTELWFRMRAWLEARDTNLAGDEATMRQLIARKYKLQSNGKMQAESKDDMKKRGLESPNEADAFMLTFAADAAIASGQKSTKRDQPMRRKLKGLV